jgi:hypothetical protein
MMSDNTITVTKPHLPPLAEFMPYLEKIWESGWLTNDGPPDYNGLLAIIKRHPEHPAISAGLLQVSSNILKQKCNGIDIMQLDDFIQNAITILQPAKQNNTIEKLYVLRAAFAENQKNQEMQEKMLLLGSAANPDGTIAKFELAYFYLNSGNLQKANDVTVQLQQLILWGPDKVRVDELNQFIEIEQAAHINEN